MPIQSGTSTIKLQNIAEIDIYNADNSANNTTHSGDNILDGVKLTLEKGESVKVASGRDRALSEKVNLTFEVIEGAEEDLVKLYNSNNCKCTIELHKKNGDATNVVGFLSVNRAVGRRKRVEYADTKWNKYY